jgi:hypothetical protein
MPIHTQALGRWAERTVSVYPTGRTTATVDEIAIRSLGPPETLLLPP